VNAWWSYFWPVFAAGLVIGAIAGSIALRARILPPKDPLSREKQIVKTTPRKRRMALIGGFVVAIAAAAIWHGPLGAADRFTAQVERDARQGLDNWEMYKVMAHLHRGPLTRRLVLSGPADDFQSSELVRIMRTVPGVSGARWSEKGGGPPLILEGAAVAALGFLFGLLLAYLVELRRRHNAQWSW
jgi:membrane protease YdiL (CAAX protease family)